MTADEIKMTWTFITTYHGPTNRTGARIIVTDPDGKRRTIGYDYSARSAHKAAFLKAFDQWAANHEKINVTGAIEGDIPKGKVFLLQVAV